MCSIWAAFLPDPLAAGGDGIPAQVGRRCTRRARLQHHAHGTPCATGALHEPDTSNPHRNPPARLPHSGLTSTSAMPALAAPLAVEALLTAIPCDTVRAVITTACLVPFLLDAAAALGWHPPWHMKLQCVGLVAFPLGVPLALRPPSSPESASLHIPTWSSLKS